MSFRSARQPREAGVRIPVDPSLPGDFNRAVRLWKFAYEHELRRELRRRESASTRTQRRREKQRRAAQKRARQQQRTERAEHTMPRLLPVTRPTFATGARGGGVAAGETPTTATPVPSSRTE